MTSPSLLQRRGEAAGGEVGEGRGREGVRGGGEEGGGEGEGAATAGGVGEQASLCIVGLLLVVF